MTSKTMVPERRAVDERVRSHVRQRRRRQIVGRILSTLGILTIIILLALLNRDARNFRNFRAEAEQLALALQEVYETTGIPPQRFPDVNSRLAQARDRYEFNLLYLDHMKLRRPVPVCILRNPVGLMLRPNVRFVVLFDGHFYRVQWYRAAEFARIADDLGIPRWKGD